MSLEAERIVQPSQDPVSNVLKWILLVVGIGTFAALGRTTGRTYEAAPPFPAARRASDPGLSLDVLACFNGSARRNTLAGSLSAVV